MNAKNFKLTKEQIAPIALGRGGCLATDRIVVDGLSVGYMYRESPSNALDSGWRFFAGDEDDAYLDDHRHTAIYDVNTIANYDPQIIAFLDAQIGSRFERQAGGSFQRLSDD